MNHILWHTEFGDGPLVACAIHDGHEVRPELVSCLRLSDAERLYERAGWRRVGTIPNYALLPDGPLCDTVFFYKDLSGG